MKLPTKDDLTKSKDLSALKNQTGIDFKGIDLLTVSIGKAKFIDLGNPKTIASRTSTSKTNPFRM